MFLAHRATLAILACLVSAPTLAATFTVNTTGVGQQADCESGDAAGDCSLRAAIQAANAAGAIPTETPPFHVIEFAIAGPITIASDLDALTAPTQFNQPDAASVSITCSSTLFAPVRGFAIPASAASGEYAIYNMEMADCASTVGGASVLFLQADSTLTIEGLAIDASEARSPTGGGNAPNGGAIRLGEGTVSVLRNVTITNSSADGDGGAISNAGMLTISNSELSDNVSEAAGGAISSVLSNVDSGLSVQRVLIEGNTATINGGGIFATSIITGISQSISDSRFTNNSTENGNGGGLAVTSGPVAVSGTTFDDNVAASTGGAIFLNQDDSEVTVTNSTFSGNSADRGGAIGATSDVATGSSVTFSTFVGNAASTGAGGALFASEANFSVVFPGNVEDPFYKNLFSANTADTADTGTCAEPLGHTSSQASGSNIADDESCGLLQATDLQGVTDAYVSSTLSTNNPANSFGGLELQTHRLIAGGPAIDFGSSAFNNSADQRNAPTTDGDENGSSIRDPGAYEFAGYSAVELVTNPPLSIDENQSVLTAQLRRYGGVGSTATVLLETSDGTATDTEDYDAPSVAEGTINFAAGATTSAVDISILDDDDPAGAPEAAQETFSIALVRDDAVTSPEVDFGIDSATTATINNYEEGIFSLSVDATATEGTLIATINRSAGTDGEVTVQLSTAASGNNPATEGDDFPALSNEPIVFASGDASKTFELDIDDDLYEPEDETFTISLSLAGDNGSKPAVDTENDSTEVTIQSEDPALVGSFQFEMSDASRMVTEGETTNITLTVTRTDGTDCAADVVYEGVDGTAASGSDYTIPDAVADRTLRFAAGSSDGQEIVVTIEDDNLNESDESFSINLASVTPVNCEDGATGAIGTPNPSVITITSDELAQFQFSQSSRVVSENAGQVIVAVEPVGTVSGAPVQINVTTQDGTGGNPAVAGSDYTALNENLVWNDGESEAKSVSIEILNDSGAAEEDETFAVMLSVEAGNKGEIVGTNPIPVTIVEQQGVRLTAESFVSMAENGSTVDVVVERIGKLNGAASVQVTTAESGSASDGTDYSGATQTLNWASNEGGSKIASIAVASDNLIEGDESFSVTLANASGFELSSPTSATATITDDDSTVTMTMAAISVGEAAGSVEIIAERSGAVFVPISVDIATVEGSAMAPEDYDALPAGTALSWAAGGSGPRSVTVQLVDNQAPDGERVFTAVIAPSAGEGNVAIGSPTETAINLLDDDSAIRFAANSEAVTASEADGTVTLTVERFTVPAGAVSVDYVVTGGTATAGSDYTFSNGTLNWADGDTTDRRIEIRLVDDITTESQETIVIELRNVVASDPAPALTNSTATIRLNDNDAAGLSLAETDGSTAVTEGGSDDTITLALQSRPTANVTVRFETPSRLTVRTANSSDRSQLVFTPANWNIRQTVEIQAVDNTDIDETVTQILTARTSSTDAGYDNLSETVSVTVSDTDAPPSSGGGSGALSASWLLMLAGLGLLRRRRLMH